MRAGIILAFKSSGIGRVADLWWPNERNGHKSYLSRPLIVVSLLFILVIVNMSWFLHYQRSRLVLGASTDLTPSQIIALTNLQRTQAGLPSVQPNQLLAQAAEKKAQSMVEAGIFDHYYLAEDGTEITPWQFYDEVGYSYLHAGENLGKDFKTSEKLVEAWMNSPAHRENLLNQTYLEIGVAVIEGPYLESNNTTLVVQLFATPLSAGLSDPISAPQNRQLSGAPALTYEESWIEIMLKQYPTVLLSSTILVTLLIALAVIIDMNNVPKEEEPHQLSTELWRH